MCLLGLTPFEYSAFLIADRPDFHPLLETDKKRVHSVVLSLIEPSHKTGTSSFELLTFGSRRGDLYLSLIGT